MPQLNLLHSAQAQGQQQQQQGICDLCHDRRSEQQLKLVKVGGCMPYMRTVG